MMDVFRRAAKSWAAKLLIGLLALSFGIWGIADVFRGYRSGALATVGGVEISAAEFQQAFSRTLQNMSRQTGQGLSQEEARKLGIDRQVLEGLINGAAVDAQAKSLKLAVSDALIAQETADNPSFKGSDGQFSKDQFVRFLESSGMSEAMYLAQERTGKLRGAIAESVIGDFVPPKALVEAFYRQRNEERDARYFTVRTAESEIAAPTEAEIKKQYDDNPATYTAPEYRAVAVISVAPADIAAKIALSEADLTAGYEKYKADYFTPERRTLLQITFPTMEEAQKAKARLAAGEDFMAIAKERGLTEADATLADKAKADLFDPAVADATFGLAEGAVSEPIKGSLSIALVKVTKVVPEKQESFEEVKAKLTERLQLERAREEIQSVYDQVEDARAAETKFEDIASRAGIPFKLVAAVDAAGLDKDSKEVDLPFRDELLKATFSSDVGVENDAISLGDGYVWYEVREVMPSTVRPLDTIKDKVKADLIATRVREQSLDKAKKLVERAVAGASLESLAQEAGATVQTAQGLKRNETSAEFDAAAVAAVFSVPEKGFAFALDADGKGATVMQSEAVLLPPFDPASADAKALADTLKQQLPDDVMTSYLGTLQTRFGVSINEDLWRQIAGIQTN